MRSKGHEGGCSAVEKGNVTQIDEKMIAFIRRYVRTVGALEVLLLLHGESQRTWSADEIARHFRGSPTAIAEYLAHFKRAAFIVEERPDAYRYAPKDIDTDATVSELAALYSERPVSVVDVIYTEPSDPVRALADAFKLKKD